MVGWLIDFYSCSILETAVSKRMVRGYRLDSDNLHVYIST